MGLWQPKDQSFVVHASPRCSAGISGRTARSGTDDRLFRSSALICQNESSPTEPGRFTCQPHLFPPPTSRTPKIFRDEWPFGRLFEGFREVEPTIRVEETLDKDTLVIKAEAPGIDPEKHVEVSMANRKLFISVERRESSDTEKNGATRSEFATDPSPAPSPCRKVPRSPTSRRATRTKSSRFGYRCRRTKAAATKVPVKRA